MEFDREKLNPALSTDRSNATPFDSKRSVQEGGRDSSPIFSSKLLRLVLDEEALVGCLLGGALGDSIGLPMEGLSPDRAAKLFPGPLRQRLCAGRGMLSDDTEHAALVIQALLRSGDNLDIFRSELGRGIRNWVASLPAGIGLATLRAGLKLWAGSSPEKSGVNSAGNGPCMRSPILGVVFRDCQNRLVEFVKASTVLTHSDPRALSGSLAVAVAAALSSSAGSVTPEHFWGQVEPILAFVKEEQMLGSLEKVVASIKNGDATREFAATIGLEKGVSGFVMHTVPVCIHAWLKSPDNFQEALEAIVRCGGDTDTTGAIVGAIVGARVKVEGLREEWLAKIVDPYVNPRVLRRLAAELTDTFPSPSTMSGTIANPALHVMRNLVFAGIVLSHGVRRLLPPY